LVERGLKGVQLIIFDACRGVTESPADTCPNLCAHRVIATGY
jgi:hypothetical protein